MFFNLFKKECRQILSSLVFYIYIVLFVLFIPEQDLRIRALIRSKELPLWQLLMVRLATAILVAAIIVLVILSIINSSGGTIAYGRSFAGSFAEIIFLGHFALFQMIRGTYDFIPWMLVLSAAFFIVGTICNEQRS